MQRRDGSTSAESGNIARIRVWRSSVQRYLHDSRSILKHHGVTTRAYHDMLEIWGAPGDEGLSIGALADLIHLAHNSAVGVADQLCKKGYAVRRRGAPDKRVVHLHLTDEGRIVLAALVDDHMREFNKISPGLRKII